MSLSIWAELQLDFFSDKMVASGWSMHGLNVELTLTDSDQLAVNLTASTLVHKALPGPVSGIDFNCIALIKQGEAFICKGGRLQIADSPYGQQNLIANGEFIDSEHLKLQVDDLKLAEGSVAAEFELTEGQWKITLNGTRLKLDSLRKQLEFIPLPDDWDISGRANLQAKLSGHLDQTDSIKMLLKINNLAYSDEEGLQVAEDGSLKLNLNAKRRVDYWQGEAQLTLSQGSFYSDPLYMEILNKPVEFNLQGLWNDDSRILQISKSQLNVPEVMIAKGQAKLDIGTMSVIDASIDLQVDEFGGLYAMALQPFLIGTMIDDLEVTGMVNAEMVVENGQLQEFNSTVDKVTIDDNHNVLALHGLSGQLSWVRDGQADVSHIKIEGGKLYAIDHGPVAINARVQGGEVAIIGSVDIPLLDGVIHIDKLHGEGFLIDSPQWVTSVQLTDISLQALADSFGWPAMKGELNGSVPTVHYQDNTLKLDGELMVDVFGGEIRVGHLLIKDPLGRVPALFADMQLSNLELEQITQTFSFGHMEGGLEGQVDDLQLVNWEPIAFKARFNTPVNDTKPHRISQRAVDNLTSLGNGVGSGLSNTFLGIFKEFRYNRIELRASLKNGVAELGGMEHSGGGYYLVKGSGLPRIDVIARNRHVAWKSLLERLRNIRVEGMEVR